MRRIALLPALLAALLCVFAPAASAAPKDLLAQPGLDQVDGEVESVAVRGDTMYVAGYFDTVGPITGPAALFDDAGGRPLDFPVLGRAQQFAETAVTDGHGGWIIGGVMAHADGQPRNALVHVMADGTVDTAFPQTNAGGRVQEVVRSGDSLYIVGQFTTVGGRPRQNVAKIDLATGTVVDGWAPAVPGYVEAIEVDGGDVFVAGESLYKLSAQTGAIDPQFVRPQISSGFIFTLALDAGNVYVGGSYLGIASSSRAGIVRLNRTTGALDTGWNPPVGRYARVHTLRLSSAGLDIGGSFASPDHVGKENLMRVGTGVTATIDPTFLPRIDGGNVSDVIAGPGGSLYVVGNFYRVAGVNQYAIARVDATTGARDETFKVVVDSASGNAGVLAAATQGDRVLFMGGFDIAGGEARGGAAAISLTTGRVTGWNPDPNTSARIVEPVADGVLLGGQFTEVGGVDRVGLAKVTADTGAVVPGFDAHLDDSVHDVSVLGGTAYAAGNFDAQLAKLDLATGAVDPAWQPAPDGYVTSVQARADGVYAGGYFTTIGGAARAHLARLSPTGAGAADPAFAVAADDEVGSLDLEGETLLVGGSFETLGGQPREGLAAVSTATGAVVPAFAPDTAGYVDVVALDRERFAYGDATGYGLDGTVAGAIAGADDTIRALDVAGQSVAVTGRFQWMAGATEERLRYLRIAAPASTGAPVVQGTPADGSTLTCTDGTWSGEPQGFAKAWLRDGAAIDGATGGQYVTTRADAGRMLSCRVTATNESGSAEATSAAVKVAETPAPTPEPTTTPSPTPTPTPDSNDGGGGGVVVTPTPTATPDPGAGPTPTVTPAATATATCRRAGRKAVRCAVVVTGAPAGALIVALHRGTRRLAVRTGAGPFTLRARKRLRAGSYILRILAGTTRLVAPVTLAKKG